MSDDYDVGYGRPPKRTQVQKGQSGNPSGRPKGAKNLKTELEEELQEPIVVREGDTRKTVSKQRAMIKGLMAKAMQGDARAAALLTNMFFRLLDRDGPEPLEDMLDEEDRAILETHDEHIRQTKPQAESPPEGRPLTPPADRNDDEEADG